MKAYKSMYKCNKGCYKPAYLFSDSPGNARKNVPPIKIGELVDEMPYRLPKDILDDNDKLYGWNSCETISSAKNMVYILAPYSKFNDQIVVVEVEVFGPNTTSLSSHQFMTIIRETGPL